MADRLKGIIDKVLEWWNKFTSKQKTILVSIAAAVIFTIAIIAYVFTRPNYVEIITCTSTKEAAELVEILDSAGVTHRESPDGLTIEVIKNQQSLASIAMGSAGFVPNGLTLKDFLDTSITTTASDREKQYKEWLEAKLAATFSSGEAVKEATVLLDIPDQNGTLMAQQDPSYAYIQLTLDGAFSSAQATAMAKAAATFLGNDNTANITILDQDFNVLFAGGEEYTTAGVANSLQELQSQAESMLANQVKKVFLGTKQYKQIEVVGHLDLDFSEYERVVKEYYASDDREEGMLANRQQYETSSSGGTDGIPGTDSNNDDGTGLSTYVYSNGGSSESSSSELSEQFLPNEMSERRVSPAGGINYDNSSLSIAMVAYRDYYEESVKRQGLLDGITWEDFKDSNSAAVRLTVDDEYYAMAANASGISRDRVTIIAYEMPVFHDKEGWTETSTSNLLSVLMILLILGLLAFVVLRSMHVKKAAEQETEEELSVESMLQSTADTGLEDIDVETKSEVRLLVEKFVDENPQAAATLLRNWLNEDWN